MVAVDTDINVVHYVIIHVVFHQKNGVVEESGSTEQKRNIKLKLSVEKK